MLSLFHFLFNQTKKKKTWALVSRSPPLLLWGYSMCIEDNACFCCGGGHPLVEPNYALVSCSVYRKFFFELWPC